jgi:hypothetical protein
VGNPRLNNIQRQTVEEKPMHKRIVPHGFLTGAAVAWLLWSVAEARAQLNLRLDLDRHPGASIHFGGHPPPPVRPVAPPASVRYEHYREREHEHDRWEHDRDRWVAPRWGAYRNPYRDDYFRRFRPGYVPVVVGTTQYCLYPTLPPGAQSMVVNGNTYFLADGIYYQPYIYQGQTEYMAIPAPIP